MLAGPQRVRAKIGARAIRIARLACPRSATRYDLAAERGSSRCSRSRGGAGSAELHRSSFRSWPARPVRPGHCATSSSSSRLSTGDARLGRRRQAQRHLFFEDQRKRRPDVLAGPSHCVQFQCSRCRASAISVIVTTTGWPSTNSPGNRRRNRSSPRNTSSAILKSQAFAFFWMSCLPSGPSSLHALGKSAAKAGL